MGTLPSRASIGPAPFPKDCVAWTSGCKKIFASWRQTNCLKGGAPLLGGRGDNKPHLKYRPTIIARESGLILQ